jgi:hypothetical protein
MNDARTDANQHGGFDERDESDLLRTNRTALESRPRARTSEDYDFMFSERSSDGALSFHLGNRSLASYRQVSGD